MKKQHYKQTRHYQELGAFLQQSRERAGLTQREVSLELAYSSAQFISNFERGIVLPPVKKLKYLIERYRMPLSKVTKLVLDGEAIRIFKVLNK